MNLLAFIFSLLVPTCLVSASSEKCVTNPDINSIKEVDSLQAIILKRLSEDILGYLVLIKSWEKDLAWAFSLGLSMGKQANELTVLTAGISYVEVNVSKENLFKFIHNSQSVKEDLTTINPFSELFDLKALLQMLHDRTTTTLPEFRLLFSKCALSYNTMISVDLAILQWLVREIKRKPPNQVIDIVPSLILPICSISLHPQVGQYFTNEVHLVLTHFEKWIFSDIFCNWADYHFLTFTSLLTIIKVHDEDCKVWQKASEIAARMYPKISNSCWKSRMLLGPDHIFEKSMEAQSMTPENLRVCIAKVSSQLDCKVHSAKDDPFTIIVKATYMIAKIDGNTLRWEGLGASFRNKIWFTEQPGAEPKQIRLFICCRFPPPVSFWTKVISWTNLKEFYGILKTSFMRRMILTYGMTILESSSSFKLS